MYLDIICVTNNYLDFLLHLVCVCDFSTGIDAMVNYKYPVVNITFKAQRISTNVATLTSIWIYFNA